MSAPAGPDPTRIARTFWDADTRRKAAAAERPELALFGTVTEDPAAVRLRDRLEKAHLRRVARFGPTTRVLDLGGGAGRLALWLAPQVREVVLLDVSEESLAVARGEAQRRGLDNVQLRCGSVTDYQPEGLFDVVLVMSVAAQLAGPDVAALGRVCASALAPGGRLLLKEPVTTDGSTRRDERCDAQGETTYLTHFRPAAFYPAAFAGRLRLLYQAPTLAHLVPWFLQGTAGAVQAVRGRAGQTLLAAGTPLLVAVDPLLQRLEAALRARPTLARLLAPVPVVQQLYVFAAADA